MNRKIAAALVVGLLVGLLIGTLLPVQAGTRHSSDRRTLEQRIARLERRTQHLSLGGNIGPDHVRALDCPSGTPAVWRTIDGTNAKLAC